MSYVNDEIPFFLLFLKSHFPKFHVFAAGLKYSKLRYSNIQQYFMLLYVKKICFSLRSHVLTFSEYIIPMYRPHK